MKGAPKFWSKRKAGLVNAADSASAELPAPMKQLAVAFTLSGEVLCRAEAAVSCFCLAGEEGAASDSHSRYNPHMRPLCAEPNHQPSL